MWIVFPQGNKITPQAAIRSAPASLPCVSTPSATEPRIFAVNPGRVWLPMQTTSALKRSAAAQIALAVSRFFEHLDFGF